MYNEDTYITVPSNGLMAVVGRTKVWPLLECEVCRHTLSCVRFDATTGYIVTRSDSAFANTLLRSNATLLLRVPLLSEVA